MSTVITKSVQEAMSPKEALEILKEGNKRFVEGKMINRDLLSQADQTASGQFPIAITLSCVDSRTSAELVFDQGMGDIFSARVAGNIVNEDVLGSMEFACAAAGSKLIVVLGHTACGAVKGACDHVELGNLTALLSKITPAVNDEKTVTDERSSKNSEFVEKVSTINVKRTVQDILDRSSVLKEMIDSGKVGIVGATHDIKTGKIHYYEDTLILN